MATCMGAQKQLRFVVIGFITWLQLVEKDQLLPTCFWNNFSFLNSLLIMKSRRKSLPTLPLPTRWKINVQIHVYFCLNISFIIFHFFPGIRKYLDRIPIIFSEHSLTQDIISINKADLHICNSPYLATVFSSAKRCIITFIQLKKKITPSLKYAKGMYWPVRPHVWEHSDHVDQSESWQFTRHSTTQDIFICHVFSKPSWKKMLNGQHTTPGLHHQCKVKE